MSNWTVTPRQAEVLTAVTRHGCYKNVSKELDLSLRTVEKHVSDARIRSPFKNATLLLLAWDRLLQAGKKLPIGPAAGPPISPISQRILRMAKQPNGVSNEEAQQATDQTRQAVASRLAQLVRSGHLRRGDTRPYRYYATEVK